MKSLNKLTRMELIKVPDFSMDFFQTEISRHLHLEFFLEKCRVIITPDYNFFTTGESLDEEINHIEDILNNRKEDLEKIRKFLLYNLSVYSALLETNSYYISQNNHLLIARFVLLAEEDDLFEVKLYTIPPADLPDNYKDKIYLGRDVISLKTFRREHLGLKKIRRSCIDQFLKLKERMEKFIPPGDMEELRTEYLQEIEELSGEFAEEADKIINGFPVDISSESMEPIALVRVNNHFRTLKHILIEIEDTLKELEARLFEDNHSRGVRYVTKFQKDITNDINYILIKINGRISDSINKIRI